MEYIIEPIELEDEIKCLAQAEFDSAAGHEKGDCCNG